jgi:hypothetical protein
MHLVPQPLRRSSRLSPAVPKSGTRKSQPFMSWTSMSFFAVHMGQVLYLEKLGKTDYGKKETG